MAELKTKPTNESVREFLSGIADERKRRDAFHIMDLMREASRAEPRMWGTSIVGYGSFHYKYASGQEGDWPILAFSPRKQNLTLYMMPGFQGRHGELLEKLGKYKTAKSCLYVNSLDDVHIPTLKKLITRAVVQMKKRAAAGPIGSEDMLRKTSRKAARKASTKTARTASRKSHAR